MLSARRLPVAVLVVLFAAAAVVLMHAARGSTFFYDDWDFVFGRRDWTPYIFMYPHNEHFSAVPVLVYKVLFETVGLDDYDVFRDVLVALNLLCGALLFSYARRRVGPWPAVGLAGALVLMGPAWWDLLWAFQIGYLASLAAGLGALLFADRGGRRADAAVALLLAVSLASSGLGIPILAGFAVEVLARPDRRSRLWVVAAPAVLYGLWYLRYGDPTARLANVPEVPQWILTAYPPSAEAMIGLAGFGAFAAVALAIAAGVHLARPEPPRPRVLALIAMPLVFWIATALTRAGTGVEPGHPRYLYPAALFLACLAVELVRDRPPRGRAAAIVTAVLAFGALNNANALEAGGANLREFGQKTRGALAAVELTQFRGDPLTHPEPGQPQLRIGAYARALRQYESSPAYPVAELVSAPAAARAAADIALREIHGLSVEPAQAPARDACRRLRVGAQSDMEVAPPGAVFVAPTGEPALAISFRRFADAFSDPPLGSVAPGAAGRVPFTEDASTRPWRVRLSGPSTALVCAPT